MQRKINFDNGAFIVSRSIFESDIWFKPPEYIKIWLYLFGKANHKDKRINGFVCKRGQCFCNYKELLEQLKYSIGYRKKRYNESFMKNIMKYLRSSLMIDTEKKPRGLLVTICNYDYYQNLLNYEKTNEKTNEKTSSKPALNQNTLSINKNVKNDKNEKKKPKEYIVAQAKEIFDFWNDQEIIIHRDFDKFKPHINAKLELRYTLEEIKEAITLYKTVLFGEEYFFKYRWTLEEFLNRKNGLDKFLPGSKPLENYKIRNGKSQVDEVREAIKRSHEE